MTFWSYGTAQVQFLDFPLDLFSTVRLSEAVYTTCKTTSNLSNYLEYTVEQWGVYFSDTLTVSL